MGPFLTMPRMCGMRVMVNFHKRSGCGLIKINQRVLSWASITKSMLSQFINGFIPKDIDRSFYEIKRSFSSVGYPQKCGRIQNSRDKLQVLIRSLSRWCWSRWFKACPDRTKWTSGLKLRVNRSQMQIDEMTSIGSRRSGPHTASGRI